jgi:TRAP-type C4-dicarboxylate transport system substrate-binding protein
MRDGKWRFSKTLSALFVVVFALAFIASFHVGPASAKAEYQWKFAQPWSRPLSDMSYRVFCDLVKKYSNGKMEIKLYPNGLLGTHDESFHAVQDGSVEIGVFSPYVTLVPGGMLNWMPWTISNWEEAKIAYGAPNGVLYKVMQKAWNEVGTQMLFVSAQGAYGIGNNVRPLRKPEDFKNLKLRVSSSLGFVRALENMGKGSGMTLETIPWADLYNALSRGVVDGCWDMWASLVDERHAEVMKYYTDLDFSWDCNNVVVNKEKWDALPQDIKTAMLRAAKEAEAHMYKVQQSSENSYKEKLKKTPGFTIVTLTPQEREVFRKKANMPAVWNELCKPWLDKNYPGQNMTQKIQAELEQIHKDVMAKKTK